MSLRSLIAGLSRKGHSCKVQRRRTRPAHGIEPLESRVLLDGLDATVIGATGGSIWDMQVVGTTAYACQGATLAILDLSQPAAPVLQGQITLPAMPLELTVVGAHAYMIGFDRLFIVDISNHQAPTLVGQLDALQHATDVAVAGSYAYVSSHRWGLQIIDVSNPTSPVRVGRYAAEGFMGGVSVAGNYACVARGSSGVEVLDVTNPAAPQRLGGYTGNWQALSVSIQGAYAYIAAGDAGVHVLNISNPASPIRTGGYDTPGSALRVTVKGNQAYVADDSWGALILSLANPASPVFAGVCNEGGSIRAVDVLGYFMYAGDANSGIWVYDLSRNWWFQPVGECQVGGREYGATIVGSYAYVASRDNYMQILDVSNPATPIHVGRYATTGGEVRDICVVDGIAYLAIRNRGLEIVDVRKPGAPAYMGLFPSSLGGDAVTVLGGYAYMTGRGADLRIIDVRNPAAPSLVGLYEEDGLCYGIAVAGSYAYLANDPYGLRVIDISNLAKPVRVAAQYLAYGGVDMCLVGTTAYVIGKGGGLSIINVSNPRQPRLIGQYSTGMPGYSVTVAGSYAYVGGLDLHIVDVSDPKSPRYAGDFDSAGEVRDVVMIGSDACLLGPVGGLQIIRLDHNTKDVELSATVVAESRPGGTLIGTLRTIDPEPGNTYSYSLVYGAQSTYNTLVTIVGDELRTSVPLDYESIPNCWIRVRSTDQLGRWRERPFRITILDVPEDPTYIGGMGTGGTAYGVALAGPYACLADGYLGLQVIDVSDPAAPAHLSSLFLPGVARDVAVAWPYAYVASFSAGLQIIDISNPAAPVKMGEYDTPGTAYAVAVSGSLAYIADSTAGLHIIDVSNPAAPKRLGGYDTPGHAVGVAVAWPYAYVADYAAGLQIIDIRNPATPTRTGFCDTTGSANGVAVFDNHAYVADGSAGLQAIDVSNPASPVSRGLFDTAGAAYAVAVTNSVAFVADFAADMGPGLRMISVANPSDLTGIGGYDTPGQAYDVALAGGYVYIADGYSGLQVLRLRDADDQPPSQPGPIRWADDTGASETDGITADTSLAFSWGEAADAGSGVNGYEYRLDNGAWTPINAVTVALTVIEGPHIFTARALDQAANRGPARSISFVVDTTPPAAPTSLRLDKRLLSWDVPADEASIWKSQVRINAGEWLDVMGDWLPLDVAPDQTIEVQVRFVDLAGNPGPAATAEFFINDDPTARFSSGSTVLEGSTGVVCFSSQHDTPPDLAAGFRYSYDFDNDGIFELTDVLAAKVTVPAVFLADGPGVRIVRGRISDQHGASTDYTTLIRILNAPPTIAAAPIGKAVAGMPFIASGSFSDRSPVDTHRAWVNYGDGFGFVPLALKPDRTFELRHTYARPRSYVIRVKVMDDDGGIAIATRRVNVSAGKASAKAKLNDGSAQRSMVTSITYTFTSPVLLDADALTLERSGGGSIVNLSVNSPDEGYTWIVNFSGPGTQNGSLADGRYTLTLYAKRLQSDQLAGDQVMTFHRLFGDGDGDGKTDPFGQFKKSMDTRIGDAGYLDYFDFDGDGDIDSVEHDEFKARLGDKI